MTALEDASSTICQSAHDATRTDICGMHFCSRLQTSALLEGTKQFLVEPGKVMTFKTEESAQQ